MSAFETQEASDILRRLRRVKEHDLAAFMCAITGDKNHPCSKCAAQALGTTPLDLAVLCALSATGEHLALWVEQIPLEHDWPGLAMAGVAVFLRAAEERAASARGTSPHLLSALRLLSEAFLQAATHLEDTYDIEDEDEAEDDSDEIDETESDTNDEGSDAAAQAHLTSLFRAFERHRREQTCAGDRALQLARSARVLLVIDESPHASTLAALSSLTPEAIHNQLRHLFTLSDQLNQMVAQVKETLPDQIRDAIGAGEHAATGEQIALALESGATNDLLGSPFQQEILDQFLEESIEEADSEMIELLARDFLLSYQFT